MRPGIHKLLCYLIIFLFYKTTFLFSEDKIQSVPLVNLEELSATFEEEKDELEKSEYNNISDNSEGTTTITLNSEKNKKIFINLKALSFHQRYKRNEKVHSGYKNNQSRTRI